MRAPSTKLRRQRPQFERNALLGGASMVRPAIPSPLSRSLQRMQQEEDSIIMAGIYDRRNLNPYFHRGGGGGGNPLPSSYRNKAFIIVLATALYAAFLYHSGAFCSHNVQLSLISIYSYHDRQLTLFPIIKRRRRSISR